MRFKKLLLTVAGSLAAISTQVVAAPMTLGSFKAISGITAAEMVRGSVKLPVVMPVGPVAPLALAPHRGFDVVVGSEFDVGSLSAPIRSSVPTKTEVAAPLKVPSIKVSMAENVPIRKKPKTERQKGVLQEIVASLGVDGKISFRPSIASFSQKNDSVIFRAGNFDPKTLHVFVRDEKVARWSDSQVAIESVGSGSTEIYFVHDGSMFILPVKVGNGDNPGFLTIPDELVRIDTHLEGAKTGLASIGSLTGMPATDGDANADVDATDEAEEEVSSDRPQTFQRMERNVAYSGITIQVGDERSRRDGAKIYPVPGAKVALVGSNFSTTTNAKGLAFIPDVPQNSEIFVQVNAGDSGLPTLASLRVGSETQTKHNLLLMRPSQFEAFSAIARSSQSAIKSSLCVVTWDSDSQIERPATKLSLDVNAEGPFYINDYGFLDSGLPATGVKGRACFFNVQPGIVALNVFDEDDTFLATAVESTFGGAHHEIDISIGGSQQIEVKLGAMGTAHEQLGHDSQLAGLIRPVDFVNLIQITNDEIFGLGANGQLTMVEQLQRPDRHLALVQTAEFEPVLYSVNSRDRYTSIPVLPLVPRGFVEDISLYANAAYDPSSGSVMAEYASSDSEPISSQISFRLVDPAGGEFAEAWYYADAPVTKAIFFNVPAGHFLLITENEDGHWLRSQEVIVYDETISYVFAGSQLTLK